MSNFYRFNIGEFSCTILSDGSTKRPLADIFPAIQSETLSAFCEEHGFEQTVTVGYNVLHIDTGEASILVDTGFGNGTLLDSMASAEIDPSALTHLIITHGDGDHIGGLDNFRAPQIVLPTAAWHLWTENDAQQMVDEWLTVFGGGIPDDKREGAIAARRSHGAKLQAMRARITLIDEGDDIVPGIRFVAAPGHRGDHFAVSYQSGGETLLQVVDAMRHPLQAIKPQWTSLYDSYPEQTTATMVKLMQQAKAENLPLLASHMPFPGLFHVVDSKEGLRWKTV